MSPLAELLVAQLREHGIAATSARIAASVTAVLDDPSRGFVLAAIVEGAIAGVAYVSFATPLEHAGEVAWLEELYVTPERRDAGLGAALLAEVCARAEARGCVAVDLEVQSDHERALGLYSRAGFSSLRRQHFSKPLSNWDW